METTNTTTKPVVIDIQPDLDKLSYADLFELGGNAVENCTKEIHLNGDLYFRYAEKDQDLDASLFDGCETYDYEWSIWMDNNIYGVLAFVIGAMHKCGFNYVGLQEEIFYDAYTRVDETYGTSDISNTFSNRLRFYPSAPKEKVPSMLFDIKKDPIEKICDEIEKAHTVFEVKNHLLASVEHSLSRGDVYSLIDALLARNWQECQADFFYSTGDNLKPFVTLKKVEKGVVLLYDGYPIAAGAEAILRASLIHR